MTRLAFKLLLVVILAATAWYLLAKTDWLPSLRELVKPKAVRIDETPVVVGEIRKLAEWTTIVAYDEVVEDTVRTESSPNPLSALTGPDRLVLVVKGTVRAGTDLSAMEEGSITRIGDSVAVTLPPARILDVSVNPSGVETFMESGQWPGEAFERVKIKARDRIRDRALQQGILARADRRAAMLMENLLRQSGFEKTGVTIR